MGGKLTFADDVLSSLHLFERERKREDRGSVGAIELSSVRQLLDQRFQR